MKGGISLVVRQKKKSTFFPVSLVHKSTFSATMVATSLKIASLSRSRSFPDTYVVGDTLSWLLQHQKNTSVDHLKLSTLKNNFCNNQWIFASERCDHIFCLGELSLTFNEFIVKKTEAFERAKTLTFPTFANTNSD